MNDEEFAAWQAARGKRPLAVPRPTNAEVAKAQELGRLVLQAEGRALSLALRARELGLATPRPPRLPSGQITAEGLREFVRLAKAFSAEIEPQIRGIESVRSQREERARAVAIAAVKAEGLEGTGFFRYLCGIEEGEDY